MGRRKRKTARSQWPRRDYLVDALAQFERLAEEATAKGSWQAAVRAKTQAVEIRSQIDQLDAELSMSLPDDLDEHRAEVLRQVRSLRAAAEASNSFVAAAKLLQLEADLVEAEAERRANAEVDETPDLEEATSRLAAMLDELPDTLKAKIPGLR